ncbi:MAG TPA: Fur family transcriptional regulator [Candidatus Izemoplasmatales bacterium]|nr:Fur family transcriptional regulator [Candidatus Izemoplasmatales bacterium]
MAKKNIIQRIVDAGLKKTNNRVNIIDILEKTSELLSAQAIYDQLNKNDSRINLSTVYRTLEKLTDNGIVNKVVIENEKQSFYEYNLEKHHHFIVCKNCNKIEPIFHCPLHEYEEKLEKNSGFLITGHRIEFYGYCKECQKKMKNSSLK